MTLANKMNKSSINHSKKVCELPTDFTNMTVKEMDYEIQKGHDDVMEGRVYTSRELRSHLNKLYAE